MIWPRPSCIAFKCLRNYSNIKLAWCNICKLNLINIVFFLWYCPPICCLKRRYCLVLLNVSCSRLVRIASRSLCKLNFSKIIFTWLNFFLPDAIKTFVPSFIDAAVEPALLLLVTVRSDKEEVLVEVIVTTVGAFVFFLLFFTLAFSNQHFFFEILFLIPWQLISCRE